MAYARAVYARPAGVAQEFACRLGAAITAPSSVAVARAVAAEAMSGAAYLGKERETTVACE